MNNVVLEFWIIGTPAPGGSKKYVGHRAGRPILVDDAKGNGKWRALCAWIAKKRMSELGLKPFDCALEVDFEFWIAKPKSVKRPYPTVKPDVLKLTRSTEDALTKIVWEDDAIIVSEHIHKRYCSPGSSEGCRIQVAFLR
jgi:Holliday junction resolvase RusA-like endonuclease